MDKDKMEYGNGMEWNKKEWMEWMVLNGMEWRNGMEEWNGNGMETGMKIVISWC